MRRVMNSKGVSLAEFLVSFSLLTLVVGGILISYIRCLEFIELSKNMSRAVQAAQSKMEEVRSTPFNNIFSTYNNTVFHNISNLTGIGSVFVDNSVADLLEVKVLVFWQNKNGRIYGEDSNLNGVLESSEDVNGNGRLDSPVEISMRIFKR